MPRLAAFALLILAILSGAPPRSSAAAKPNIVVILADDLGYGDLRCYNPDSKIPTPNLDRLATEGMRFTDAHSPSAVCTPTRYGLLTGRYAWRTRLKSGVLWGYSPPLIEPDRPTLASFLRSHGYSTACIGKWHLGLSWTTRDGLAFDDSPNPTADPASIDWSQPLLAGPHTAGFDAFFGIPASLDMVPYVFFENDRVVHPPTERIAASRHQRQGGPGFWREGPIAPGFTMEDCQPTLTRRAIEFIQCQSRRQPFFLYFALTSPHDPWVPTPEFAGRSGAGPRGDFVMQVDHTVGQVLTALRETGLDRRTLLLFTSDNGAHWLPREVTDTGHAANHPWRGMKSDAFEGGHRVPLIARWPGRVPARSTSPALVGLNDLFATFAEILDQPLPAHAAEDSVSFARHLRGRRAPERPPLILHSIRGTFAVRHGPWKYIHGPDSGGWTAAKVGTHAQLYHLGEDPGELHNRFSSEPDRVAAFQAVLPIAP